jgi:hypothetical protein
MEEMGTDGIEANQEAMFAGSPLCRHSPIAPPHVIPAAESPAAPMPVKRVFNVKYPPHSVFAARLNAHRDGPLGGPKDDSAQATVAPILAADAFQIGKGRAIIRTCWRCTHGEAVGADALWQAIAGAGLAPLAKGPPPPDHPLTQFDKLVSPHLVSPAVRSNTGRIAADELLDARDGQRRARTVNPEACVRRFRRTFGYGPGGRFEAAVAG